jgi:hypothetical protein
LISHELAELQEAEAMEQDFVDYMERKRRPKVTDPFVGQLWRPQPMIMSQHDYDDIVAWGESIEKEEARKEKMRIGKFLIMQQPVVGTARPVGSNPDETRTLQPFGSRAARRLDAKMLRAKAKKGKCR